MKSISPWQEAGMLGLVAVLASACADDLIEGSGTEGDATTTGSSTSPSTSSPSTSTSTSTAPTTTPDPTTTTEPPTTTSEPTTDTTTTDPTVATDMTMGTTETTFATEGMTDPMTDTSTTTTGETTIVLTDSASSTTTGPPETTGTTGTTVVVDETTTTTTTDNTTTNDGSSSSSSSSSGTTGPCPDGDADMDMICDSVDLCDDLIGTHCLEFNIDGSAVFDTYDVETDGILAPLLDANIIVGVTLVVDSVVVNDVCDAMAGTTAKEYDVVVGAFNMWSDDPTANDYLQDEIMAEWLTEWVGPTVRFFALGAGTDPRFEVVFSAGTPPGHLFGFSDATSYDPVCEDVDIDSTITGTDAVFRVDYHGPLTLEERMTGVMGEYILYPTG